MSYQHIVEPFKILDQMDSQVRHNAQVLTKQKTNPSQCLGIRYKLMNTSFVTYLNSIAEVVTRPAITRLPGVKSWIIGIANIRGVLLPIIDLARFLSLGKTTRSSSNRLFLISQKETQWGLLVDQVLGLQHFSQTKEKDFAKPGEIRIPYVSEMAVFQQEEWYILDIKALINSSDINHVQSSYNDNCERIVK